MKNIKDPVIVICGGHTGGHFFPAVSFGNQFLKSHPEVKIHILLSRLPSFSESVLAASQFKVHLIDFPSFSMKFSLKSVLFLIKYIFAFLRTFVLFMKLRPSLIAGFGSYSSIPGVLSGALLGVPIVLHEQNAVLGRANQFLIRWARVLAVSFPQTAHRSSNTKMIHTGYPLRDEFLSHRGQEKGFSLQKKFRILVFGGSQGAKRLNDIFLNAICMIKAEEMNHLAVTHIVGNDDINQIRNRYLALNISARVESFSHNMSQDLSEADFVISRSGAGTIFELAALGKPSVLVPYPHAYAHQKLNADFLVNSGAAKMIKDEQLTPERLSREIEWAFHNRQQLTQMSKNIRNLFSNDASTKLVQVGWNLLCEENLSD